MGLVNSVRNPLNSAVHVKIDFSLKKKRHSKNADTITFISIQMLPDACNGVDNLKKNT